MRNHKVQLVAIGIAFAVTLCLALLGIGLSGPGRSTIAVASPNLGAAPHTAPCQQFGVNLSGGEFGSTLPGTYGTDYIYPGIDAEGFNNAWELDYFHSKGLNLIRVPIQWERLQHDLNGPLSTFDLGLLDQLIANAASHGMSVILGPHNFARRTINGTDYLIGSPQVPYSDFTDFWHKMAAHFAGQAGIYAYALDNEPHDTGGLWVTAGAQAGVDGVRMADMQTPILIPGDGWSGAWTWLESGNDALKTLNDPANKLIFEAHQYFDGDGGGDYAQTYDQQGAYPNIGVDRLQEFVTWLHTNNLKGVVDEYGVPDTDSRWLTVLSNALTYLEQNSDVILGGDDWSAGPWWDSGYPLSVEPTGNWPNVTDRPQMTVLQAHTGQGGGCGPSPSPTPGACSLQFSDVPVGSTFYTYVRCMACQGIITGYSSGCGTGNPCFRPSNNVTRGQLAKVVSNSAGFQEAAGARQFQDVPAGSTFYDFIWRLANRGYIGGYACGGTGEPCGPGNLPYFRPNAQASRGQISKIVSNAAGFHDLAGTRIFEDVPAGSTFYDFVQRLASRQVMAGYACGGPGEPCNPPANRPYFRPNNNATRGQTSKIVSNTFFPDCQTQLGP